MFCHRLYARWQRPPVLFDFNSMSWFLCETRNSLRNFSHDFLRRRRYSRSGIRRNNGTIFNSQCRVFVCEEFRRLSGDFLVNSSQIFSYSNSFIRFYYEKVDVFLPSSNAEIRPEYLIVNLLFSRGRKNILRLAINLIRNITIAIDIFFRLVDARTLKIPFLRCN